MFQGSQMHGGEREDMRTIARRICNQAAKHTQRNPTHEKISEEVQKRA